MNVLLTDRVLSEILWPTTEEEVEENQFYFIKERLGLPEKIQLNVEGSKILQSLYERKLMFVISNPLEKDCPIIHASSSFLNFTQYSNKEIIGKNCRFLQGEETNRKDIEKISRAIKEQRPCSVMVLNYKANGDKFMNRFYVTPLYSPKNEVVLFVGIQIALQMIEEERKEVQVEEYLSTYQSPYKLYNFKTKHKLYIIKEEREEEERGGGDERMMEEDETDMPVEEYLFNYHSKEKLYRLEDF